MQLPQLTVSPLSMIHFPCFLMFSCRSSARNATQPRRQHHLAATSGTGESGRPFGSMDGRELRDPLHIAGLRIDGEALVSIAREESSSQRNGGPG